MSKRNGLGRVGLAVVLMATMIWSGCSTNWISEGEEIVSALIPAAANIVALVAALQGKTVSAADMNTIQNAGTQAGADLQLIQSLIAAYQKADASAQPGILNQIQVAIGTTQANLQGLLPALHIKDAATEAKITAVVGIVLSEVESLAAVVPLVSSGQGSVASGQYPNILHTTFGIRNTSMLIGHPRAPLSAKEFVASFNATLTAKTGNAELDRAAEGLQIHLHSKVERVASGGILK